MAKTIEYGVWGCGGHAIDAHGVNNKAVKEMVLAGVSDIDAGAMKNYCLKYGSNVPEYINHETMINKKNIDAVLIMTPDKFHTEHLREAIVAELHVMIEKPVAITKDQMEAVEFLLNYAKSRNLIVTSCHPRRFDPPFVWTKQNMEKHIEMLGPVIGFHFDFIYHKPFAEWKNNRSLLLDHAGHEIDLVTFLFGRIPFEAVLQDDSFDRYLVTGKREDGINFSFHGTRRMEERVFHEWMTIRHSHGSIVVNTSTGVATIHKHNTNEMTEENCGKTDYVARSVGVLQNFADAINGTAPNYLSQEDLLLNNGLGIKLLEEGKFTYLGKW